MDIVNIIYNNDKTQIYIHTNDYIGKTIKNTNNFYEYKLLSFLQKNFNNQKNILDIGANIGNHSLFFAKYFNCNKIFSFEPYYKNIELFINNLSNYKDKCILYKNALSYKNDKMIK